MNVAEPARTNYAVAAVAGLGAGFVGGAIWYAITAFTERQYVYLAIILGVAIGYATSWGAGKGGVGVGALSGVLALVSVVVSYLYIDRYFVIEGLKDLDVDFDIPLVPGFTLAKDILREGFAAEPTQYLYCALCILAAVYFGYKGSETSRRFGRP